MKEGKEEADDRVLISKGVSHTDMGKHGFHQHTEVTKFN